MAGADPIYLDANATTEIHPEVLAAMRPYLEAEFGNPSSLHGWGQRAKLALDEARLLVAAFLGCGTQSVVFTSSGSEANNLAIIGHLQREAAVRAEASDGPPSLAGFRCVVSAIEHSSVMDTYAFLEKQGVAVDWILPGRDGRVKVDDFEKALGPGTKLASCMAVNNETGVIQPAAEIAALARSRGIASHVDAVQAAGKLPVSADSFGADYLSLSAHKIEGPKGCGVLYVRPGKKPLPIIHGGSQEAYLRGGTHNLPAIVGCGAAFARIETAARFDEDEISAKAAIRDRFEKAVLAALPEAVVNGASAKRVWNTSNISFPGLLGKALLVRLDLAGVAASLGSACASGAARDSHVLTAMGLGRELTSSAVRFSFAPRASAEDADRAAALVTACVLAMERK